MVIYLFPYFFIPDTWLLGETNYFPQLLRKPIVGNLGIPGWELGIVMLLQTLTLFYKTKGVSSFERIIIRRPRRDQFLL